MSSLDHQNRREDSLSASHTRLHPETTNHTPFHILSLVALPVPYNQEFQQLNTPKEHVKWSLATDKDQLRNYKVKLSGLRKTLINNGENTNARRLRFHCCNCSSVIIQCSSVSWVDSLFLSASSSRRMFEYFSSRGLHNPKSESFKWPFLSNIKLSGFMSLDSKPIQGLNSGETYY